MPGVAVLQLHEIRVTDSGCALIVQKFPSLSELDIDEFIIDDHTQPSDKGMSAVRKLPRLERFTIEGSESVSNTGIGSFSGSPKLKELHAEFRGDVAEVPVRIHDCPLLERLDISQCESGEVDIGGPWKLFLERGTAHQGSQREKC